MACPLTPPTRCCSHQVLELTDLPKMREKCHVYIIQVKTVPTLPLAFSLGGGEVSSKSDPDCGLLPRLILTSWQVCSQSDPEEFFFFFASSLGQKASQSRPSY